MKRSSNLVEHKEGRRYQIEVHTSNQALRLVDEITLSLSQNRAISRMMQAVFDIADAHEGHSTPDETAFLFEGLSVIAQRIEADMATISKKITALYELQNEGGAR